MKTLSNLLSILKKSFPSSTCFSTTSARRHREDRIAPISGLEERLLLDIRTWTGGALLNDKWSDKDNWAGKVVPKAGDDIRFPTGIGTLDRNTNMDIASATFRNITFEDSDFKVTGKALTITGNLSKTGSSGINEITNTITFSTAAHTIDVASGQLTLSGTLKGVRSQGVGSLTKTGIGGLAFTGTTANTLVQNLIINHGELVMSKSNSVAAFGGLSITVAGASVGDRPKLEIFQNNALILPSSIQIETFPGAPVPAEMIINTGNTLRAGPLILLSGKIGGGTLQFGGDVTVKFNQNNSFDSVIAADVVNLGSNIRNITTELGASLDIQSRIEELSSFGPGTQGFRKRGEGVLELSRPAAPGSIFRPNTYAGQTVVLGGVLRIDTSNSVVPVTLIPGDLTIGTAGTTTPATFTSTVRGTIASKSNVRVRGAGQFVVRREGLQTLEVIDQGIVNNQAANTSDSLGVTGLTTMTGNAKLGSSQNGGFISNYLFRQFRIDNASIVVPGGAVTLRTDDLTLVGAQLELPNDVESALIVSGKIHTLASANSSSIKGRMKNGQEAMVIDVADGSAVDDLVIDATIARRDVSRNDIIDQEFTKAGNGTLLFNNRLVPDFSTLNAAPFAQMTVQAGTLFSTGLETYFTSSGASTQGGTSYIGISTSQGIIAPGVRGPGILKVRTSASLHGLNSKLQIELNGVTPGTQHDQLQASRFQAGLFDLTDLPVLEVLVGFTTALNQTFKIVDITDPADPSTRLFRSPAGATLTEGSVFTAGGVAFQISYVGGDGNDITLKRVSTPPAFQNRTITPSVTEGGVVTLSGLITEPDSEDTFFLDVDWGDGNEETFTFAPGSPHQVAVSHRYLNDAPTYSPVDTYPVRMVWHDEHGGSNSATLQTIVRNVAPEIGDLRFETPPVHGQAAILRGSLFDPGPQDRILVKIDWGDGSALETVEVLPGEATFAKSHLYATPGVYRVSVQPADERTVGKKMTLKIRVV